jgi:hypothetical protein
MANRSGLLLNAAVIALLSAPAWAAGDEPIATAPIPPPLTASPSAAGARAAPSTPDTPAFVKPAAPKPSPPKSAAAPTTPGAAGLPKRPVRSAAKAEPGKKGADRHRPTRQAKKDKEKEHHAAVAQAAPSASPVRKPRPRPRYYADYAPPPPPPWYDREVPFAGYYPGPWRRGPVMMPW